MFMFWNAQTYIHAHMLWCFLSQFAIALKFIARSNVGIHRHTEHEHSNLLYLQCLLFFYFISLLSSFSSNIFICNALDFHSMQHLPIILAIFNIVVVCVYSKTFQNYFFFLLLFLSSSSKPVIAIKISYLFVFQPPKKKTLRFFLATAFCFTLIKFGIQNEYFIVKLVRRFLL